MNWYYGKNTQLGYLILSFSCLRQCLVGLGFVSEWNSIINRKTEFFYKKYFQRPKFDSIGVFYKLNSMSGKSHWIGSHSSSSFGKVDTMDNSTGASSQEQVNEQRLNGDANPSRSVRRNPSKANKLKVELCKNYSLAKSCPYQSNCRFAHGLDELLHNTQNYSTFKTKNCKAFFTDGYCKYGHRCNFKHDSRTGSEGLQHEKLNKINILEHYPELLLVVPTPRLMYFKEKEQAK